MPSIAVDAGPLVALFKGADHSHARAITFVQEASDPLVTNLVVISEVAALLTSAFQPVFLTWAVDALEIDQQTAGDLPRIIEIMTKYADLPADFADASLVALCERRGIATVATLDRHFDIYRMRDRKRLRNVFPSE